MKTITINGNQYRLKSEISQFLDAYLQRIASFVEKYHIDVHLHQDILQIIDEKLAAYVDSEQITQKEAIQIVNSLGEPEEIFAELVDFSAKKEEKSESKSGFSHFYEKMQAHQRSRPQENAVLLGVCAMLAKRLNWNVWLLRALVLLCFVGGIFELIGVSMMIYFWAAIIYPRAEKNYGGRSVLNYFLTQVRDLRLMISNLCRQVWKMLTRGAPKSASLLGKIFWGGWAVLRFLVLCGWCMGMLLVIAFGGALLYGLLGGVVIKQMDIVSFFPAIFPWATGLGMLAAIGFFALGVQLLLRRKIKVGLLISTCILAAFSLAGATIVGENIYTILYAGSHELTKEITIPVSSSQVPFLINMRKLHFNTGLGGVPIEFINESSFYTLIPSDEKEIKVVYTFAIIGGKHESSKKKLNLISENLSDPVYLWNERHLMIGFSGNQLLDSETPYLPIVMSVDLYIPKDLKFFFAQDGRREGFDLSVQKPVWANKYGGNEECVDEISYKSDLNAFYCEVEMSAEWKRRIILRHLEEKGDELAPFVGTNWDFSFEEDRKYWRWHSARALDEQHFLIKLSDRFFNLFLKVEVDLDKEAELIIKKVELESFEQKGLMNEERFASYQGLSGLDLDLKVQGEKEELLSRIRALEKELEVLEMQEE